MKVSLSLSLFLPIIFCRNTGKFLTNDPTSSVCGAIYASSWLVPSTQPAQVSVKLLNMEQTEKTGLGYVLYEYFDDSKIGWIDKSTNTKYYFCTEKLVGNGPCNSENVGRLITSILDESSVKGTWIRGGNESSDLSIEYPVSKTGFYCLRIVNPDNLLLRLSVKYQSSFGKLRAELFPIFKCSEILILFYGTALLIWSYLSFKHRKELVPTQNYIGLMIFLLLLEMIVTNIFYNQYNKVGAPSKFWMVIVSLISSIRGTATLFLLLLISIGYGVILSSLGEQARSIYLLTGAHLIFSGLYALVNSSGQSDSLLSLLLNVPVSFTYSIFFVKIIQSLSMTKDSLSIRKQRAKLKMYQNLTWILLIFFIAAALAMISAAILLLTFNNSQSWYANNWKSLWLVSVGWSMIMNFFACLTGAWVFRPRSHNRTYGMNELSDNPIDDDEELELRATAALEILRSKSYNSANTSNQEWKSESLDAFGGDDESFKVSPTDSSYFVKNNPK